MLHKTILLVIYYMLFALCLSTPVFARGTRKPPTAPIASITVKTPAVEAPTSVEQHTCPITADNPQRATSASSGLLCVGSTPGQWFPAPVARMLLTDLKLGKAALSLQPKLEQRVALGEARATLLRASADTAAQLAGLWKGVAVQHSQELRKRDSVWRSPVLWFAVGLALGVGGVTTAVIVAR